MTSSVVSKVAFAMLLGLLIFGVISAFQVVGTERLKEMWEDNPKATGIGFFAFSQGLGSITPYWDFADGKVLIPYPDNTDLIGLFLFSIIALLIIYSTPLRNNYALVLIVFLLILSGGWIMWKIIMYYIYIWGASQIGLTYLQSAQIRKDVMEAGSSIALPILVITLFTLLSMIKFLPRPK